MKFSRPFFLFAAVGTVGFVVDTSVLYLLKGVVGLYFGRLFSFVVSVFVTWVLNRSVTFADRASRKSKYHEFAIYFLLMTVGGLVNYSIYAGLVSHFSLVHDQPVWGVAAGSVAGLVINLLSSRFLLFRFQN